MMDSLLQKVMKMRTPMEYDDSRRHNFKLHPSKRCLFQTRIKILGHILDEQRIYPLDKIIARIQGAARPRSKDEIRAFIGVVGYYQKFIPQFAERAHHRQKLIGRDATFS